MSNSLSLLQLSIAKSVLLTRDALGDMTGHSLPYETTTFLQPDHLSKFLNQFSLQNNVASQKLALTNVETLNIESISSNCQNTIVKIQPGIIPNAGASTEELIDTLFVKLPSPSLLTRWFFSLIGSWELEVLFFQRIADRIPVRTPKTYAAAVQGSRFALIQENLLRDPSVRLFTNLNMLQGPPLDIVEACLDCFAKIHASHHGLGEAERNAILPMSSHIFLSPPMKQISQALNKHALKPCLKKQPGVIPPEVLAAYQKTLDHWDELLGIWFQEPLDLIHGDSHLGNFFVDGEQMGMLDWQAVHWGKGVRDVQYFLIDSLPVDLLAEHEERLLQHYIDRLNVYGVELSYDVAWQQYRSFSYHTLMTIIVSIGFGAMNEKQNELMSVILKRAVAAVQRLDYAAWLDSQC